MTCAATELCSVVVLANFAVFSRVPGTDNCEQMRSSAFVLAYRFAYTLPGFCRLLYRSFGLLGRSLDVVPRSHGDVRMAQNRLNHHILNAEHVQVRRKTAVESRAGPCHGTPASFSFSPVFRRVRFAITSGRPVPPPKIYSTVSSLPSFRSGLPPTTTTSTSLAFSA